MPPSLEAEAPSKCYGESDRIPFRGELQIINKNLNLEPAVLMVRMKSAIENDNPGLKCRLAVSKPRKPGRRRTR